MRRGVLRRGSSSCDRVGEKLNSRTFICLFLQTRLVLLQHTALVKEQRVYDERMAASALTEEEGFDVLSISLTDMPQDMLSSVYASEEDRAGGFEHVPSEVEDRLSLLSTIRTRTETGIRERIQPVTQSLLATFAVSPMEKAWVAISACLNEKSFGKLESLLLKTTAFGPQLTDLASQVRYVLSQGLEEDGATHGESEKRRRDFCFVVTLVSLTRMLSSIVKVGKGHSADLHNVSACQSWSSREPRAQRSCRGQGCQPAHEPARLCEGFC